MNPSFVSEIVAKAGEFEKEDLNSKLEKLCEHVQESKVEVYDVLKKKYVEFYPSFNKSSELSNSVTALNGEMDLVSSRMEKEIKRQLQISTSEYQQLSTRLIECKHLLSLTSKLLIIHELLTKSDNALIYHHYFEAASYLTEVGTLLYSENAEDKTESDIKILLAMKNDFERKRKNLEYEIDSVWSENIKWKFRKGIDQKEIGVELVIQKSSSFMSSIFKALDHISLLSKKMNTFSHNMLQYVLKPIIKGSDLKLTDTNEEQITMEVEYIAGDSVPFELNKIFEKIKTVIKCLKNVFSTEVEDGSENLDFFNILSNSISCEVITLLKEDCLINVIPSSQEDLENYKEIISQTKIFQEDLVKLNFIKEDNTALMDYATNVNVLFANKKCQELLTNARQIMTSTFHNTLQVNEDYPFGKLPNLDVELTRLKKGKMTEKFTLSDEVYLSAKVLKLPQFHVSVAVQQLIILAYETFVEATQSKEQFSVQLFYCIRSMFELFINVVPIYHKEQLENIPQCAAIHHNNCLYIAHHLLTLGHQYRNKLPALLTTQSPCTFLDLVPIFRRLGSESLLKQINFQKLQIMNNLSDTKGMTCLAEGENKLQTQTAINQIMYQLRQLSNVWQPVLPEYIYCKTIGTLLNTVITELMKKVISLEDISADEAIVISDIMKNISKAAPYLYKNVEVPEVLLAKYVRKWSKYEELLLVLNAGLIEISDRWADGKGPLANEFSANEVKQLIRALFQNTEKRSTIMAKIK